MIITNRSAGILLHITSLPGPLFIGDIGTSARDFVDFLHRSNQVIWQMLPIQPVTAEQGYSPYSATSAFAGNNLLISLDLLRKDGLLSAKEIRRGNDTSSKADFRRAKSYKEELLEKAWQKWRKTATEKDQTAFVEFCASEAYWLNDFALYTALKIYFKNKPWFQWPEPFRNRDTVTLGNFASQHRGELDKIKWFQQIFDRQWKALRSYCSIQQVQLLGDIPIYVAHDSADVWSHPELFTINQDGSLQAVAGVPPDLFNDNGQLWGMPLFRWDVLKQKNYHWWVQRIRKNLEYFDLIRLDHFRGFSSYWSVSANAKTARNGKWLPGPASDFFQVLKDELGRLPFVAEDLGDIDKPVYQLRDEFNLPGMNVLQFAFGDDMPASDYLPHHHKMNSIVYPGTHDNNTSVGWYREQDARTRKNLAGYTGTKVSTKNVAELFNRLAYMSVANTAILSMQDVLALDASARMNMPASASGNWRWRLKANQLTRATEHQLNEWCFFYDRIRKKG